MLPHTGMQEAELSTSPLIGTETELKYQGIGPRRYIEAHTLIEWEFIEQPNLMQLEYKKALEYGLGHLNKRITVLGTADHTRLADLIRVLLPGSQTEMRHISSLEQLYHALQGILHTLGADIVYVPFNPPDINKMVDQRNSDLQDLIEKIQSKPIENAGRSASFNGAKRRAYIDEQQDGINADIMIQTLLPRLLDNLAKEGITVVTTHITDLRNSEPKQTTQFALFDDVSPHFYKSLTRPDVVLIPGRIKFPVTDRGTLVYLYDSGTDLNIDIGGCFVTVASAIVHNHLDSSRRGLDIISDSATQRPLHPNAKILSLYKLWTAVNKAK